jgi:hypothetical protein
VRKTKSNVASDCGTQDCVDDDPGHCSLALLLRYVILLPFLAESVNSLQYSHRSQNETGQKKNNREGHEFHSCQFSLDQMMRLPAAEGCFTRMLNRRCRPCPDMNFHLVCREFLISISTVVPRERRSYPTCDACPKEPLYFRQTADRVLRSFACRLRRSVAIPEPDCYFVRQPANRAIGQFHFECRNRGARQSARCFCI